MRECQTTRRSFKPLTDERLQLDLDIVFALGELFLIPLLARSVDVYTAGASA
jgi:hypothetical protein